MSSGIALGLHGGCGTLERGLQSEADWAESRDHLAQALRAGWRILRAGGSALDAVQATVVVMEDSPHFNAGHGAALTERAKNVQPEAQFYLGQTNLEEKKFGEALKEFAAVAVYQLEPWYSRSMLQMAHASMGLGDRQAALRSLQLLRRNFPESDAAKEIPAVAMLYGIDVKPE